MKKYCANVYRMMLFFVLASVVGAMACFAAESTGDVPVDKSTKEKMRKEIMGSSGRSMTDSEYIVGYRDIIYVEIYGEGSMSVGIADPVSEAMAAEESGDFIRGRGSGAEVRMDGRISLKHIGDVYVVDMTLIQIADYLKKIYSSIYEEPSITVTLVQSNSRVYTMMGQVKMPGLFHLDFPMTIVKAVAKAGGFTEWANSEVTVIRQGGQGQSGANSSGKTFEFDYDDFLKGKDLKKNIMIQPGDILVIH